MSELEPASPPPDAALALRYLIGTWRRTALVHAFDEVDALDRREEAPTSGRAVDLSARASRRLISAGAAGRGGARPFAIRPWTDPEAPQRGRPHEFWLFSCRIVGDESIRADAEAVAAAIEALRALRLTPQHVKVRISHRDAVRSLLVRRGVDRERLDAWFPLLHRAGKMSNDDFITSALELGMEGKVALDVLRVLTMSTPFENPTTQLFLSEQAGGRGPDYFKALFAELSALGVADWCVLNLGIVRAGAHHSGMVFEVHPASGRGRSIAGGGRSSFSDAAGVEVVGFDMGDAALLDMLREASLLPAPRDLAHTLGARTQAVVGAIDDPDALAAVFPTVASLRRAGIRSAAIRDPFPTLAGLQGAAKALGAHHAVLIESGQPQVPARVANLDAGAIDLIPLDRLAQVLSARATGAGGTGVR